MNRRTISANRCHAVALCALTAAAVLGLLGTSASAAPMHLHGPIWWAVTDPVPPPPLAPELWSRFWFLYSGYSSLPSPKPMSFSDWITRHGVVDPVDHDAMMVLYRWIRSLG